MVLLIAATIVVLVGAASLAAVLRLESLTAYLLAVYLLAAGTVVAHVELLSLGHLVGQRALLIAAATGTSLSIAVWSASGRPRPPALDRTLWSAAVLRTWIRQHPLLALLALAVLVGVAYQAALVALVPPNNWDSMTYHLSRAAGWYHAGGIDYLEAHTERQNAFPPNAEMFVLFTFAFLGTDALAAAPQLLAEVAAMLAVAGIALRLGFPRAQAAFAALLLATLTQVALQGSTTQNDLLTASFVGAAAFFLIGEGRRELPLAGLAVGLALGTKLTAVFALPVLVLLALLARPRRTAIEAAAWAALGVAAVGAFGYALNLVHTGSPLGADEATAAHRADGGLVAALATAGRIAASFLDLPATPALPADEDLSYFGPLGALLIIPVVVATLFGWLRRRCDARLGAIALALPLFVAGLSVAYRFNPWIGRFLVVPIVLVTALAAPLYARKLLLVPIVMTAIATLAPTHLFNHAKPSGLGEARSVWSLGREEVQSLQRPALAAPLAALAALPAEGRVGYVLGEDEWDYPLYGSTLRRDVRMLPRRGTLGHAEAQGVRWIVLGQEGLVPPSHAGWRVQRFLGSGWKILYRS